MSVDLRQATAEDFARFKWCLSQDDAHKTQDAEDWRSAPGEFMTVYDNFGNRQWLRIERVLRVSIQHDPDSSRKTTLGIFREGFRWLMESARNNGYTEILFESKAPKLIKLAGKVFGLKPLENNFSVLLDR